jgi:hypothetical protein
LWVVTAGQFWMLSWVKGHRRSQCTIIPIDPERLVLLNS